MANVERLRATLDRIERNFPEWNQMHWGTRSACGTTYCFAGHALILAGDPVDVTNELGVGTHTVSGRDISTAAREWLELSDDEVGVLFYRMYRTLASLREAVDAVVARSETLTEVG